MHLTIVQPPYPAESRPEAARACHAWMRQRLEAISPGQTDLILLPEYANAPGLSDRAALLGFAAEQGSQLVEAVAGQARRLSCLVAVGATCERPEGPWVNRTWLFGRDGEPVTWYDKTHLTEVERQLGLAAGADPVVHEHEGVRFGFAVCFDAYFPQYFEALAARSVDVILCPSYQRSESPARIRTMCQCRALDTGAYLVRSSYAMGTPDAGGHSLVACPDGSLAGDLGAEPGVLTVEIDPGAKFVKPASHGEPDSEHRALISRNRRAGLYRPSVDRLQALLASPFPRLCAHRGVSDACPENTLPAFGAAIALGVHELELDLWMSADGVPVVCHDPSVDRTTDGQGTVTEMDWADLRRLDAGVKRGEAWAGVRIPRFEEVLDAVDGRAGINIHLKEPGPDGCLVKLVCDLLRERGLPQLHYLAGDEPVLEAGLNYAPEIPRACLAAQGDPVRLVEVAQDYGCTRVQFGRNATKDTVRRARDLGILCNLFWSDEPEDAREYVELGIQVILTNAAHKLLAGGFQGLGG